LNVLSPSPNITITNDVSSCTEQSQKSTQRENRCIFSNCVPIGMEYLVTIVARRSHEHHCTRCHTPRSQTHSTLPINPPRVLLLLLLLLFLLLESVNFSHSDSRGSETLAAAVAKVAAEAASEQAELYLCPGEREEERRGMAPLLPRGATLPFLPFQTVGLENQRNCSGTNCPEQS
jgi:hypothetical protein